MLGEERKSLWHGKLAETRIIFAFATEMKTRNDIFLPTHDAKSK